MESVGRIGWLVELVGRSWSTNPGMQIGIGRLVVAVGHIVVGRIVHIVEHTGRIEQQRIGGRFG